MMMRSRRTLHLWAPPISSLLVLLRWATLQGSQESACQDSQLSRLTQKRYVPTTTQPPVCEQRTAAAATAARSGSSILAVCSTSSLKLTSASEASEVTDALRGASEAPPAPSTAALDALPFSNMASVACLDLHGLLFSPLPFREQRGALRAPQQILSLGQASVERSIDQSEK